MAISLLSFPNEILIHIISRISNADLDNFTSTCKIVRVLAAGALREHRIRQKVFAHISFGKQTLLGEDEKETTWDHPNLMLRSLIRNDLLCYPITLSVSDPPHQGHGWVDGDSESENDTDRGTGVNSVLKSFAKEIEPLVKMCSVFDGNQNLSRDVLEGDINATLGLLLNILPKLRKLRIKHDSESLLGTGSLKRILDSMLTSTQESQQGSKPSLSKLESVIFDGRDTAFDRVDNWDLSAYASLFHFPSMRLFRTEYLRDGQDCWVYPEVQSHIDRLEFHLSIINVRNLQTCLKATQNLLHFEYWGNCGVRYGQSRPRVRELAQTVLDQAGHSLRYLEIQCWADHEWLARAGGHFVGSLKAFRVLDTIKVGSSMFVEPVETRDVIFADSVSARKGRTCRLIDVLPSSVGRITFTNEMCFNGSGIEGDVATMLQLLPQNKAELLPHLELVTFELEAPQEGTIIDPELLYTCDKAGVKIVVQIY